MGVIGDVNENNSCCSVVTVCDNCKGLNCVVIGDCNCWLLFILLCDGDCCCCCW